MLGEVIVGVVTVVPVVGVVGKSGDVVVMVVVYFVVTGEALLVFTARKINVVTGLIILVVVIAV